MDASWILNSSVGGASFPCTDAFKQFVFAGSCRLEAISSIEPELEVLRIGFHWINDLNLNLDGRYTDCVSFLPMLNRRTNEAMCFHLKVETILNLIQGKAWFQDSLYF